MAAVPAGPRQYNLFSSQLLQAMVKIELRAHNRVPAACSGSRRSSCCVLHLGARRDGLTFDRVRFRSLAEVAARHATLRIRTL